MKTPIKFVGPWAFDSQPTYISRLREIPSPRDAVAAISKRAAKHDKRALKALRRDGVRPRLAPERAMMAAGLRHHANAWQWRA